MFTTVQLCEATRSAIENKQIAVEARLLLLLPDKRNFYFCFFTKLAIFFQINQIKVYQMLSWIYFIVPDDLRIRANVNHRLSKGVRCRKKWGFPAVPRAKHVQGNNNTAWLNIKMSITSSKDLLELQYKALSWLTVPVRYPTPLHLTPTSSSGAAMWSQSRGWSGKPAVMNECNHLNVKYSREWAWIFSQTQPAKVAQHK